MTAVIGVKPGTVDKQRESSEPRPSPAQTIEELLQIAPESANVLHRFGLDTCCSRGLSLEEACRLKGIPLDPVVHRLQELHTAHRCAGCSE